MKISVVINTLNAEKYLHNVLESVKNFDEILICDMHSEDSTIDIAKKYNCRIIFHEKTGFVEPARNFAIRNATHDWILLLDADETVNNELVTHLKNCIAKDESISCVKIPRKNYFLGKFMRSAYPDYVYRFFKKDKVFWPEFIHSTPQITGKIYSINNKEKHLAIEHLANDSITTIANKTNIYSNAEVEKRAGKKISLFKLFSSPFFWFFKFYIIKGGILDGKEGLIFAILKSQYKFMTMAKIYEFQKKK